MYRLLVIFSAIFITLFSCGKKSEKSDNLDYNKGSLTILADDSFKSLTEALADAYMINYPETKISVKTMKEDLAFMELLKGNARLIVMSRDLNAKEKAEYERVVDLKYQPAKIAADGVVFVVPISSSRNSIGYNEISKGLVDGSTNFIFDGANAGNLNFVAQKLGKNPADLKFNVISGNEALIRDLHKYPNAIGVIGLNTISRPYGKQAKELRNLVKILPVEKGGVLSEPSSENFRSMKYPFTRIIYFLSNEGGFRIASGVIRFSATQLGQLVVEKEGLQPYNFYRREVEMR